MAMTHRWSVDIYIDEHEETGLIHAEARLHTNDKTQLIGHGSAHRHPKDTQVAEIGDELAVARALSELSHHLVHAVARDLEDVNKRFHSADR
ncbi:uncharacterized protein DUF1876 [Kribbella orskensis]|uniref:Uncharacterized protein DUF1876 n=1 Tax=Kribbella orskensis TaxID=2512216 RepID=A0ABY2B8F0_9ACTN|nr:MULTISPECIES: DUF1876 domain-containing protein [Kribbella]TCN31145.1 uncharacterized protein DUF1876 [Kribbella sp. VKM Ac-2500]TCO11651.1 uncharacterized protein DUF1876 [Kribbella orskensis]